LDFAEGFKFVVDAGRKRKKEIEGDREGIWDGRKLLKTTESN
jgi:hypothetical protein